MRTYLDDGWRLLDDNPNEWELYGRAGRPHDLTAWRAIGHPLPAQAALLALGEIAHPYYDLNSRAAEWIEHRDWVYGLDFEGPALPPDGRLFLEFEAVDDACLVYLNGLLLTRHEGPGAPFEVEIGPHLRPASNQLLVVVKAPRPEDPQIGRTENTRSLKGRMGFGWDFAPRLVRVGLAGRVSLLQTGPARLKDLWVRPELEPGYQKAWLDLSVAAEAAEDRPVRFEVSREGRQLAGAAAAVENGAAGTRIRLERPELWWPNGLGGQPLYTVRASFEDGSESLEIETGLRELKWERRPGAPAAEWPLILAVNGRPVFQRGWNWVPADALGGPAGDEQAGRLLALAQAAGVNILRCWGGADPETEAFYRECDRRGLLVWQEFPLSSAGISNAPPDDPAYLERLAAYAEPVIKTRRNHPCLAVWGGGNELTEPGPGNRPLTLEHPYARTLHAAISRHDPARQFRPSSPLGPQFDADPEKGELWDVHGPWDYSRRWPGPQYWRLNAIRPLLHSETGLPGEASLATRHQYLSEAHRRRNGPAWRHHGGAWWEHHETLEQVFGPLTGEEQTVLASQWLQAEGLRYAVEESRRRWPHTAGVFPWQLNEPWPLAVCTSAVEYGGQPKLAYYAVRQAFRPRLLSARYPGLRLAAGEPLRAEIWACNDLEGCNFKYEISLRDLDGKLLASAISDKVHVPTNTGRKLLDLELPLPAGFEGLVQLELAWNGQTGAYLFSNRPQAPLREALQQPELLLKMFEPNQEL